MKKLSLLLIMVMLMLALCSCAAADPGAEETAAVVEDEQTATDAVTEPVQQGMEAEPAEAPEPVTQIGGYQSVVRFAHNNSVETSLAAGALRDINGDGQAELILSSLSEINPVYQIWTLQDSKTALLLAEGQLFNAAGGPYGGVCLLIYEGEEFLCVWNNQPTGDIPIRNKEHYLLYRAHEQNLELVCDFSCRYPTWQGIAPDPQYQPDESWQRNGREITAEEFSAFAEAFVVAEPVLTVPYGVDYPPGAPQAGRTYAELLRELAGLPQEPLKDLDEAVSAAIIAENVGGYWPGDFPIESHITFKTVEDATSTTVYAMVLYSEYDFIAGSARSVSGSHVPTALTFARGNNGYTLTEYWQAEDGSRYAPSIREKFPADIAEQAMDTQIYIEQQEEQANEKAKQYLRENYTGQ